jgi:hypothetical protein
MKLFRMKKKFCNQYWFTNNIYKFIKNNDFSFGSDCTWEDIITGEKIEIWNTSMEELSKEDIRNIQIEILIN